MNMRLYYIRICWREVKEDFCFSHHKFNSTEMLHRYPTQGAVVSIFFFHELNQISKGSFSLSCHLVVKGEHNKVSLTSPPQHHCTAGPLIVTNGDLFTATFFKRDESARCRTITHEKITFLVSTIPPSCRELLICQYL